MKQKIIHIYPSQGGIAEYSKRIDDIYREQGFLVEVLQVEECSDLRNVMPKLSSRNSILHFEVGASDSAIFTLSRRLLNATRAPQLVTIHDPGVVVRNAIDLSACRSSLDAISFLSKAVRKLLNVLFAKRILHKYLESPSLIKIYLREDLARRDKKSYYLPQPLYSKAPIKFKKFSKNLSTIGFSGYWGHGKGIETLVEAWQDETPSGLRLIISGGTTTDRDSYASNLRQVIRKALPSVEMPGLVPSGKLDDFLTDLDILILPYWPELPNGTSAMALRAAELGTAVIASDLPALREELGKQGAIYVKAKDPASLREAVLYAQENWAHIQVQSRNLQVSLSRNHSWREVGNKLSQIIAQVRI